MILSVTAAGPLTSRRRVHGGSFLVGASTQAGLDGSTLASTKNMIVVTLQYRLGLFGFLKSSSAGVTGNFGLKDVLMAMRAYFRLMLPLSA